MAVYRDFLAGGSSCWTALVSRCAPPRGTSGDQGPAGRRPGAGRAVPVARAARRRRHGRGLPREVTGRAARCHQADPARAGRRARLPVEVLQRDQRRAERQRDLHRGGRRRRRRRGAALDGHRLRAWSVADRRGGGQRPAARRVRARPGSRPCRGAAGHPPGQPGAPGPQAVQRAARGRRPPGDRLRHLAGA